MGLYKWRRFVLRSEILSKMRLLLIFLISFVDLTFTREVATIFVPPAADKCTIGKEWVIDFIKFKCFQVNRDGVIKKGVRGIGCVPENAQTGKTILNGTTWTDTHFTYLCNKTREIGGSVWTFKPINCLDNEGKILKPGEERKVKDGSKYKCFFDKEMDVHLSIDGENPGCVEGVQIYKERSTWMRYRPIEVEVSKGKKVQLGIGVATTCIKNAEGKFSAKEYGCITSDNHRVDPDSFGLVETNVVKCVREKDRLYLELANEDLVSCQVDGKRVVAGTEWENPQKTEKYLCNYGKVIKSGCLVKNEFIPVHEFRYIQGIGYQCGEKIGDGYTDFGNLKGCNLENGTLIEFFHEYETENKVNLCRFRIDDGKVQAVIQQIYCRYHGEKVALGEIVAIGLDVIKCELKGNAYLIRKLDEIEMNAWKQKSVNSFQLSADFEAQDGEGKGQIIRETVKTTKATTIAPSTTKAATTPAAIKKEDCKNWLDDSICDRLSPICSKKFDYSPSEDIEKILEEKKLDKDSMKKISGILDRHLPRMKLGNITETCDILFDNGCSERRRGCLNCASRRVLLYNLVSNLCPKTCLICGSPKENQFELIVESALKFYETGCH